VRAEAAGEASNKNQRAGWCCLLACLLAAFCLPISAHAQSLDEVVNGVESTYGKITDLRAEFTQTARNKSLGQDIKAEGIVLLKKGGKMRWDYQSPAPQQIVSDGTSLWVYTPELNQVNKGNAPKALAGPAGSFLSGLGKLREEFSVRFLNPANPRDGAGRPTLDLTPKQPTPLLTRLVISVDPKDHVVRQAVLYDQFQNTVTMTFNRVSINPGLSDTLFAFTPPKDAAVVPLDPR
jgi:outer membrane lipoprotein carrier protein